MLDPRRLLTFREVARERSFSRAAVALSLTQPAVSQQIRGLETQLGERLIERGRAGGFALTATGELLLAHADAALGPQHRLAARKRIRLAELADDPWLAATRDGLIVRGCRAAGFEPRLEVLTDDPLAINSFVAAGLTVTLTSELLAGHLRGIALPALAGEPV